MTTDELEQTILALQDRVWSLNPYRQKRSLQATRTALRRMAARRRQIAKRTPHQEEV